MGAVRGRVLILCKTYPSPSGKHAETSCVAAIDDNGNLVRLFPVPFRLISDAKQFRKWQWVSIQFQKARKDHRPESHTLNIDAIECDADTLSTKNNWEARRSAFQGTPVFSDYDAVERNRIQNGHTLALLRPKRLLGLDITPLKDPLWTAAEKEKLLGRQKQAGLFDANDATDIKLLRKLPFDFHYRYVCEVDHEEREYRHKIVDWEVGALFWNCHQKHGRGWEEPFRQKLEIEFASRDLIFLMGTIHRFPDQWLIVSLIYPPKEPPASRTPDLFD